ncbi:MAG: stage IV sporulation protein A, partial [Oscillospiraceae bacterium]|nr:stage IV sporulation protein A [Oscillospiraceae bacterium]
MNIYDDIQKRTQGSVFIGVVGAVRTGKSTFIKKFMEALVIPNIQDADKKVRTIDELPQSAAGRTIMTTQPNFIPEQGVDITVGENKNLKVRLVDCVGYMV